MLKIPSSCLLSVSLFPTPALFFLSPCSMPTQSHNYTLNCYRAWT
jgi:hypothetical protein